MIVAYCTFENNSHLMTAADFHQVLQQGRGFSYSVFIASRVLLALLKTLWLWFHAHLLLSAIKVLIRNNRSVYRICTSAGVLPICSPAKCSRLLNFFRPLSTKEKLSIIYSIILCYLLATYPILNYNAVLAEFFPLQGTMKSMEAWPHITCKRQKRPLASSAPASC